MNTRCKLCQQLVPEAAMREHLTVGRCASALLTFRLLCSGFRPLPSTHSLPPWCVEAFEVRETRGKYDGEPREDQGYLDEPCAQLWVPRWLDIIVTLWAGPIALDGETRRLQRDCVIALVKTAWTSSMKARIVDAYSEDLRAVRDLLRSAMAGPPPQLISEVER